MRPAGTYTVPMESTNQDLLGVSGERTEAIYLAITGRKERNGPIPVHRLEGQQDLEYAVHERQKLILDGVEYAPTGRSFHR